MKRKLMIAVLVGILAVIGLVSVVAAQGTNPPVTPPAPGQGYGRGGMMGSNTGTYGPMHEYMEAEMAEALGLTEEELEAKHAEGLTFWQIAEEQGLTVDEASQAMLDARSAALDAMVADGSLTAEQAEWMKSRGSRMGGRGAGMMGGAGCLGTGPATDGTGTPRGRMGGRGSW